MEFDSKERIVAVKNEEELELVAPVETKGRNLEEWMSELDNMIKISIKENIVNFLNDCPNKIEDLLPKYCSQAIMLGTNIIWTGDVEKCFEKGEKDLNTYW